MKNKNTKTILTLKWGDFFSVECRLFVFMLRSFLNVYSVHFVLEMCMCASVRACKVSIQCVVLLLSYALVCDRCLERNCRHTILYGISLSVLCCMRVLVFVVGTLLVCSVGALDSVSFGVISNISVQTPHCIRHFMSISLCVILLI